MDQISLQLLSGKRARENASNCRWHDREAYKSRVSEVCGRVTLAVNVQCRRNTFFYSCVK